MKFFSSFLKHKKIITFVLIFFVIGGIIIPQIAFASWYNPFSWLGDAVNGVLNGLIYAAMFIPLFLTALLADIAGTLLKWVLSISTTISYTDNPAVNIGWLIVRDFANMFIVLGFVVIGIATTLRIKEYEAKQTLAKLIIAALLINFSLLITGIFIDASNIATNFFFSKIGNSFFAFENIKNSFTILGNEFTDSWLAFGPKLISMIIFNFFIFFIFLLYLLLLLFRIVAIWTLVILSPLAFVCYVFPATKNIWQTWWKNFSQWCIIGIPAGLFLYIGSQMMSGIIETPMPAFSSPNGIFSEDTLKTIMGFASSLLPGLFLIIGFLVSLQFSAMGAGALLNAVNKNKGKIVGGGFNALSKTSGALGKQAGKLGNYLQGSNNRIGKGAGWALNQAAKPANALGNYRATSEKTRSAFGRALEGAGAIPVGTQAGKDDKGLADAIKALTAALKSGNKKDEQRVLSKITSGTGADRTAAILAAISEGKLHEAFKNPNTGAVNHSAMNDAISAAEKSGAPKNMRKDALDKYYQMAGFTDKNVDDALTSLGHKGAVDAELTTQGVAIGTATPAQRMAAARSVLSAADISRAEKKADAIKLTQNWGSMDTDARANADLGNLHSDDLKEFVLSRNAEDIKAFRLLDSTHVNRGILRSLIGDISAEAATAPTNKKRRLDEVNNEINKL